MDSRWFQIITWSPPGVHLNPTLTCIFVLNVPGVQIEFIWTPDGVHLNSRWTSPGVFLWTLANLINTHQVTIGIICRIYIYILSSNNTYNIISNNNNKGDNEGLQERERCSAHPKRDSVWDTHCPVHTARLRSGGEDE